MKCNQFSWCRLLHSDVNHRKFNILGREKQSFDVYSIIQNGRYFSFPVLYRQNIKSNAELYVIREKSAIIPLSLGKNFEILKKCRRKLEYLIYKMLTGKT